MQCWYIGNHSLGNVSGKCTRTLLITQNVNWGIKMLEDERGDSIEIYRSVNGIYEINWEKNPVHNRWITSWEAHITL